MSIATPNAASRYRPLRSGTDVTAFQAVLAGLLSIDISGNAVDTGYTQFNVARKIGLQTARLELTGDYVPQGGDVFTIAAATAGGLTGSTAATKFRTVDGTVLGNNSTISFNGQTLRLNYNTTSVTLTTLPSASLNAANNLVITGSGGNDGVSVVVDGANLVVTNTAAAFIPMAIPGATLSNGDKTITIPLASVPGPNVIINTGLGDDTLTVDFSGGLPRGVQFNGGAGGNDTLVLGPGATTSVTHTFANATDGRVTLAGALAGTIAYTGLDPITDNLAADDRVFTFTGGAEAITLAAGGTLGNVIVSTLAEAVDFANPTKTLTINAGTGADTVTIAGFGAGFAAALVIDGGVDADAINLNAAATLAAGNSLAVTAEKVTVGAGVALVTSGTGTITITADEIDLNATSVLQSAGLVSIQPQSADQAIDLGGADAAGTLGLSRAELHTITAATLTIGTVASGAITVSDGIDLTDGPVVGTLVLSTAKNVVDAHATGTDVAVSRLLALTGTGLATRSNPLETSVDNFSAVGTGGGIFLANAKALTVGGVDAGTTATQAAGRISITAAGDLTVAQPVTATAGGGIELFAAGVLTLTAAGPVSTTVPAGVIELAGSDIDLDAAVVTPVGTGGNVLLRTNDQATSATPITLGTEPATGFGLTNADLGRITADFLTVGLNQGTVTVTDTVRAANVFAVGVVSQGDIVSTNPAGPDFDVPFLRLNAAGGLGSASTPLELSGSTLVTFTNGDQFLSVASPVAVGGNGLTSNAGFIRLAQSTLTLGGTGSIQGKFQLGDGTGTRATLAGSGQVIGNVTVGSDGTLSPGFSPGVVAITGDLTLTAGSVAVEVNGAAAAGVDYDQVQVGGTVTLGGATLATIGAGIGIGDFVRVIDNQGPNPITGTFAGLAEGATRTVNGVPLTITYAGTGNEVLLVALAAASIADVSAAEGDAGGTTFTVTLAAASSGTVAVDWTAADGTATAADGDYQAASGTVTFAPGQTTQTFTVTVTGDRKREADETFGVTLSNPTGTTLTNTQAVGTIVNDDPVPTVSVSNVTRAEGNAGTTAFTFAVTLSNPSGSAVAVDYATANGTATAGNDYQAATGTVTFQPGETSQTVTVLVTGDGAAEADETFAVDLSAATNATVGTGTATATITTDDPQPTVALSVTGSPFGENGGTATVTATLSNPSASPVTITLTFGGTAVLGTDYDAAATTIVIPPGALSGSITLTGRDNSLDAPDKTVIVTAAAVAGGTAGGLNQVTATIADDDRPAAVATTYATAEDAALTVAAADGLLAGAITSPGSTAEVVGPGPANGTLAGQPDGHFTYTPAADFNGTDAFQYRVRNAAGEVSDAVTVTVGVAAVNDPPSFVVGPDQTDPRGTGPRTVAGFATAVSAGPADENTQPLAFQVTTDNPALFAVPPAIDPATGTLTYTPAAFAFGTAVVTVRLTDGGTGANASAAQTFTITVNKHPTESRAVGQDEQPVFAVGADAAGPAAVTVYRADGSAASSVTPFPGTTGGVRTAVADVTGDGVAGTGPGVVARVRVFDAVTGAVLFDVTPFEDFTGGVFVAAGDFTGDGRADVVITPDLSGGPRVEVYRGDDFARVANFFGIDDPNFRGGARAAAGDVTGDGVADLVVSAGFGGGPRLSVYDGAALAQGKQVHPVGDFFLFESTLRNGAYVAVGDVDGDGLGDVIGGAGPGGGPRVLVVSGRTLTGPGAAAAITNPVANLFAGNTANRDGVRVAAKDLDGDSFADVVTGAGSGSRVTTYRGAGLTSGQIIADQDFDAVPEFVGGVFIG